MSRADEFDAFCRESRDRLLHQVYAYAGTTPAAQRALSRAYVSAAHHWGTVAREGDKDAWMRAHAFKAASKPPHSREPWYLSAVGTADENRLLLSALSSLPPSDRHLLIAHHVAGLELPAAAREVRVTERVARQALEAATATLAAAGVDVSPAPLGAAFESLRSDLRHEHPAVDRLRREGSRRRHSRVALACLSALALAVSAVAITAVEVTDDPTVEAAPTTVPSARTDRPAPPEVSATDLSTKAMLRSLDRSNRWKVISTSTDLGAEHPADLCLPSVPTEQSATHYWVRTFSTGRTRGAASATQTLEVTRTPGEARTSYAAQLAAFGGCQAPAHRVVDVSTLQGVGERAALVRLQFVDKQGIQGEDVAVAQTGSAVTAWIVRESHRRPTPPRFVVKLLASSVDTVCGDSEGGCAARSYRSTPVVPPADEAAKGFLSTVDLPLFEEIADPWVATPAVHMNHNPAATRCDQADFATAGATTVRSRTYVIPGARRLLDVFGMSETVGSFKSGEDAKRFVHDVTTAVTACSDSEPGFTVAAADEIALDRGQGFTWRIELRTSTDTTLVFRVALLRVGPTVAQVTFTPSGSDDVSRSGYLALATRAAARLTQL